MKNFNDEFLEVYKSTFILDELIADKLQEDHGIEPGTLDSLSTIKASVELSLNQCSAAISILDREKHFAAIQVIQGMMLQLQKCIISTEKKIDSHDYRV